MLLGKFMAEECRNEMWCNSNHEELDCNGCPLYQQVAIITPSNFLAVDKT